MNAEDMLLANRVMNIQGIWEEHGFVIQPMKFMRNAPLGINVPENLYDPVSFLYCIFTEEIIEHIVF